MLEQQLSDRVLQTTSCPWEGPRTYDEARAAHEGFKAGLIAYATAIGHVALREENEKFRELMDESGWRCVKAYERMKDQSFSARNLRRCEAPNGFNHKLNSWSLSDWMTATAGELGEAANVIKKLNRVRDGIPGNKESPEELRAMLEEELADVSIYLDLLAQAAGVNLEAAVEAKFAKTSAKIGYVEG